MSAFINSPREFELRLVEETKKVLGPRGQVLTHTPLWVQEGPEVPWSPDLLFVLAEGSRAGQPHVVEFKFFRGGMMPPSIVVSHMGVFERMNRANDDRGMRFAFVTNTAIEHEFIGKAKPPNVELFDRVVNEGIWRIRLMEWIEGG